MTRLLSKHSTLLLIVLLVALPVLAWLFPSSGVALTMGFFVFAFFIVGVVILHKHGRPYSAGEITGWIFAKRFLGELAATALAMALAGFLGRTISRTVMGQIDGDVLKLAAGIGMGLLVGSGVGMLYTHAWERLVKNNLLFEE